MLIINFLKKLTGISNYKKQPKKQPTALSLDHSFVHHFIEKGGKFLYCSTVKEVVINLNNILLENNWKEIICVDYDLPKFLTKIDVNINTNLKTNAPLFTPCEYLIANQGGILFSSNQIKSKKLSELTNNFIVYATTSQLVKNSNEALENINKKKTKNNIPANISPVKEYGIKKNDDNLMNSSNSNSKNLYLLLFEDL